MILEKTEESGGISAYNLWSNVNTIALCQYIDFNYKKELFYYAKTVLIIHQQSSTGLLFCSFPQICSPLLAKIVFI
jgi:hypothetical protein